MVAMIYFHVDNNADQEHPLDGNDKRDHLAADGDAHINTGGPPPYKENDTLGRSATNRPDGVNDISEDRTDEERDRVKLIEQLNKLI